MKKLSIFIMAFVAIISSCSTDNVQNDLNTTLDNDALQTERYLTPLVNYDVQTCFPDFQFPLIIRNENTKTLKLRSAGTTVLLFPPNNNCNPNEVEVVLNGEGHATHLGLFTFFASYCSLDGINPVSPILGVQTAANGDELYSVLVGAGEDPELGYYQDWVFYGGSGRFEDATGEIRLYAIVDFINLTWSNHGVGTITY